MAEALSVDSTFDPNLDPDRIRRLQMASAQIRPGTLAPADAVAPMQAPVIPANAPSMAGSLAPLARPGVPIPDPNDPKYHPANRSGLGADLKAFGVGLIGGYPAMQDYLHEPTIKAQKQYEQDRQAALDTARIQDEAAQAEQRAGTNQTREDVAADTNATRRAVADTTNETRQNIADSTNQTRTDIAADTNATRGQIAANADETRRAIAETSGRVRESIAGANRQLQDSKAQMSGGKVNPIVAKSYGEYQDSVSQLNRMNDSLEPALKGDQQAMLNILMNHIGMTLGAQKGARITQAIIKEAETSAPYLGRIEASFDKDGVLSGAKLTPQQMHSMIALGHSSLQQAQRKFEAMRDYIQPGAGGGAAGASSPSGAVELERGPDGKLRPKAQ
jgi:hypothetical protein